MLNGSEPTETVGLTPKSRPQYHYFYGSTDGDDTANNGSEGVSSSNNNPDQEQDSLIGEELVSTDHEEDGAPTPSQSEKDLEHLVITNNNGTRRRWWNRSPGQTGPGGVARLVLVLALALLMSTVLVVLFPHTSETLPQSQAVFIPFPAVLRSDYGDPVDKFIDTDLFHPSLLSDTEPRTFVFPFPTGAFWTNLVLPSPDGEVSYPIVVYPYSYKWSGTELQVSYPYLHRFTDSRSIRDTFAPELSFTTTEDIQARYVTKFDPLSVTLRYVTGTTEKWEASLVQGSPYVTLKYIKATPVIKALSIFNAIMCPGDDDENFSDLTDDDEVSDESSSSHRRLFGVCSIDESDRENTYIRGVQFIFKTPEGQRWIMFASEPINLIYDNIRKTTISSSDPFTGVIRLALVPSSGTGDDTVTTSTGLRRLIYHAGVFPIGGDVSWEYKTPITSGASKLTTVIPPANATSKTGVLHFNFKTQSMTDTSLRPNVATNGLLMLALPHHAQLLPKKVLLRGKHFDLTYHCIKGPLTPVVGSTWSYEEPLLAMDFDAPQPKWDDGVSQMILDQVDEDLNRVLPTRSENVYGFGKQVARLAQLVHITHRLNQTSGTQQASDLLDRGTLELQKFLGMFMSSNVSDALLFDSNMGGIVSTDGLYDKGEDFGNGRYNDHHFHYGYLLYASAIMASVDPSFVTEYGPYVDAIFHDVAHYSNGDSQVVPKKNLFFPLARHKSWYDGHSFATGMFPFGNGKSQESSSEAVNCYFGAYLWARARRGELVGGSELVDFTRLLLAMEIRGAQTYWHMVPADKETNSSSTSKSSYQPYTPNFRQNYMVGNVGMLDVSANTWFGNDNLYVHMINALPITAITAVLFQSDYVSKEYPFLMGSRSGVEMAWRGYTVSIEAIYDPIKAWKDSQSLVSYELDSAISKSQVLYFIATRPGFNISMATNSSNASHHYHSKEDNDDTESSKANNGGDSDASCSQHDSCAGVGLVGFCCPTGDGKMLGCCD